MTLLNKKKKIIIIITSERNNVVVSRNTRTKKKKLERDRRAEKVMPPSETFGCTGLSNVLQHTWLREVPDEKN